jgi:hypothetical protein
MKAPGVHQLVLHPVDPDSAPSFEAVVAALRAIDFLGEPLSNPNTFAVGPEFLGLITFLGCSPSVDTELGAGCAIHISRTSGDLRFRGGIVPRCPVCRGRLEAWEEAVASWRRNANYLWTCPECGAHAALPGLDWRHGAGFGRFFVDVFGIYPSEAVPGERLMEALSRATGGPWEFFYTDDSVD